MSSSDFVDLVSPKVTPQVPEWFASRVIQAGKIIGREIHVETAIRNLQGALLRAGEISMEGRKRPLSRKAEKVLLAMALLADENRSFTVSDAKLREAMNVLVPVIEVMMGRLGHIAKCLITGEPNSPERMAEIEKRRIRENVTEEDIAFLSYLLKGLEGL